MSTLRMAPSLAVARLRAPGGGRWPDLLAVAAFGVCTWLAMTVAGGTWMFVARDRAAAGSDVSSFYIFLAAVACALLVLPILSLGGAAARLGASSRATRLASLRLVGATSGEVVSMSVVEALVQATAGVLVGAVVWAVSLPAWTLVSFQGRRIGLTEMLPPWWLALAVVAAVLVLAALSTAMGLSAVRISPLGVAAQHKPAALRWWRAALAALSLVAFVVSISVMQGSGSVVAAVAILVVMMLIVIGTVNLVGPWLLQLIALLMCRTGDVSRLLAWRRILHDPRGAWRSIGSVAMLSLVAGFVSFAPMPTAGEADDVAMMVDLRTGVVITLGIGLVLAASATAIAQAAAVFDRKAQLSSLDMMGVARSTLDVARRWEVLAPLVVVSLSSAGVGALLCLPLIMVENLTVTPVGAVILVGTMVAGLALSYGAAELCRPLTRIALGEVGRRAD